MLQCPQLVWAEKQAADDDKVTKHRLHIFDNEDRYNKGQAFWLSHFPECDNSQRIIAADATLDYMLTDNAETVARRIFKSYGAMRVQLKFVIVLRDPLARIQSALYYHQNSGSAFCKNETAVGFKGYVERYITNNTRNADSDPCQFVKNSNYTRQLKAYFDVFLPGRAFPQIRSVPRHTQFIVIPFQDLVSEMPNPEGNAVVGVWKSLGLNVSGIPSPAVMHVNQGAHPSLTDDLGADLYLKAKNRVAKSIRYKSLAGLFTRGVSLPTYEGNKKRWGSVSQWLWSRW